MRREVHVRCGKRSGETTVGNNGTAPRADFHYNTRRIQKRLGWRSPDEYEAAYWNGEDLTIPATKTPAATAAIPTPPPDQPNRAQRSLTHLSTR